MQVRLEESTWLAVELMIPCDGFSAEVVRGVPPGLAEFVAPLQRAGLCRLAHQPHARGDWAVYMCRAPPRPHDPRPVILQLHKSSNGMGLSIVAAKVLCGHFQYHVDLARYFIRTYKNIQFICVCIVVFIVMLDPNGDATFHWIRVILKTYYYRSKSQ